jgi:phosphonate transport system permease protein
MFVAVLSTAAWAFWEAEVGRREVLNPEGAGLTAKFFRAAVRPRADAEFLRSVLRDTAVTVSYAIVATILSVILGLLGAALLSEAVWRRHLSTPNRRRSSRSGLRGSGGGALARWLVRAVLVVPRGIHEAVWGLLLLSVLGRNPLVAVLAIAIPYGAITARVYADLIDESAMGTQRALRASGAGRLVSVLYGVLPDAGRDLVSYGFYRFECSLRSAVILGMIGAGGLGFQLQLSFSGLAYSEMWTCIYVLVIVGVIAEGWGRVLRARASSGAVRISLVVGAVMFALSAWHLRLRPSTLWSSRTRDLGWRLARESWPPRLPRGGWGELAAAAKETLHTSFLAIAIACALGIPLAMLSVHRQEPGDNARVGRWAHVTRPVAAAFRVLALGIRTIPPTVWAVLVLFVVYPGVLPGAIALGIFTAGVLARLFGDVVEHADGRARRHARGLGASGAASFLYGVLPDIAPKWAGLALYRWEVAAREAVVVGIVGAGGLGRLLSAQTNAFNYRGLVVTLIAMIGVTMLVDALSSVARRTLR